MNKLTVKSFDTRHAIAASILVGSALAAWALLPGTSPTQERDPASDSRPVARISVENGKSTVIDQKKINTMMQFQGENPDVYSALGTLALTADIDSNLIAANKFESVPRYRINHVIDSLLAQSKLSPKESNDKVYQRVTQAWRDSCKPKIEAGKPCDFIFRFDAREWTIPVPDYTRPITQADIRHITPAFIESLYQGNIESTLKAMAESGRHEISFQGSKRRISKKAGESAAEEKARVIDFWRTVYLKNYYVDTPIGTYAAMEIHPAFIDNPWNGIILKLPEAPKEYKTFLAEVSEALDQEYLRKTREKIFRGMVGSKLNSNSFFVSPRELQNKLNSMPGFRKQGQFALIHLSLENKDSEKLKAASDLVVKMMSENKGTPRRELVERIQSEIKAQLDLDIDLEQVTTEETFHPALSQISEIQDRQLFQILFEKEISGKADAPTSDLVYFLNPKRKSLSFAITLNISETQTAQIALDHPRLNLDAVEDVIVNERVAQWYKNEIARSLNKVSIDVFGAESLLGESISPLEIHDRIVSATQNAPQSKLMDWVFLAPLKPSDLK